MGGWLGLLRPGGYTALSGPVGHSELQGSPFNDEYFTNYVLAISKKGTDQKIVVDGLTPYLIYRYGFYQGGEFRVSPEDIARFFQL